MSKSMPDFEIKDVFRETRVFTSRSIVIGVLLLTIDRNIADTTFLSPGHRIRPLQHSLKK